MAEEDPAASSSTASAHAEDPAHSSSAAAVPAKEGLAPFLDKIFISDNLNSLSPSRSLSDIWSLVVNDLLPDIHHPLRPISPPPFCQNLRSNYVPPPTTTLRSGRVAKL
ncbi:hypothetical protein CVT25_007073 [Psilocybe cyanescens]|uniref:Uncharacterized protein n=1 Tax=Psilocybe cyanescens TaxID=93625 RepID=A0A409XGG1_PSICY|nr:hypothetical protein CVT25_007073 [Psilocybe cyanescens]